MTAAPTACRTWISFGSCMAVSPADAGPLRGRSPAAAPARSIPLEGSDANELEGALWTGQGGCEREVSGASRRHRHMAQRALLLPASGLYICISTYLRQFRSIRRGTMTFASRLLAASFLVLCALGPGGLAAAQERRVPSSTAELTLSYAPVVQRVAPAVVNVYAARVA